MDNGFTTFKGGDLALGGEVASPLEVAVEVFGEACVLWSVLGGGRTGVGALGTTGTATGRCGEDLLLLDDFAGGCRLVTEASVLKGGWFSGAALDLRWTPCSSLAFRP